MKYFTKLLFFLIISMLGFIIGFLFILPIIYKTDEVYLPKLIGLNKTEAIEIINSNDLKYELIYVESIEDENIIVDIYPNKDYIKKNTLVTLKISKEKDKLVMPNYLNKYLDEINIDDLNIKYNIIYQDTNNYLDNQIIDQYPKENKTITNNDEILLVVAKNNNYVNIPNMVGWNIDKVTKFETNNNLYFEYEYIYSSFVDKDIVISQSVEPNKKWMKNSNSYIKITVSKGIDSYNFINSDIDEVVTFLNLLDIEYNIIYVYSNYDNNIVFDQYFINQVLYLKVTKGR